MQQSSRERTSLTAALTVCLFTHAAFAQDECSTAVTAVIGANAFDTTNATSSPEPVNETQCAGTYLDWGSANKDVWFRYTAPTAGYLNLNTCWAGSFDTSMVIYSGTCGALTQIACNGDGVGFEGCQAYYSRISQFEATAGTTYYIRIGGWNGGTGVEAGAGALSLSFQPASAGCFGATGDCAAAHTSGGCSDPVCCVAVCDFDPSCCDDSWSSGCVSTAVDLCGLFAYDCVSPNPLVANDCAPNAELLQSDTFRDINNAGCNTDGPNHIAADCNSGNDSLYSDIWYRVQARANGPMVIQTCVVDDGPATTFDTKLAVYDMGMDSEAFNYNTLRDTLVGCNDDAGEPCAAGGGVYPSYLSVDLADSHWYLIRVGSYDYAGTARVTFDFPEPCTLPKRADSEVEICGTNTNGGCDAGGNSESLSIGQTVRGSFWIDTDRDGRLTRDLDWYRLEVTEDQEVTIELSSRSYADLSIVSGNLDVPNCAGILTISRGEGFCPNRTVVCLRPGTYYIVVGMRFDAGIVPCGSGTRNEYALEITAQGALCPTVIEDFCTPSGPDTAWSNNQAPPAGTNNLNGIVACAVNPAFPNCSGGGTAANKFARVFTAGQLGGELTCLEVGFFSVKRTTDAANTQCVFAPSDLLLPATVYLCRDTDGASPRNVIESPGDGGDLEVIAKREVLVPGMKDTGTLEFNPPLCLEGVSGNIVVVLDYPSLYQGLGAIPASQGYGIRPAGLTVAGQPSQVFVRLSCFDSAGQFIPSENVSSTFNAQWFVGAHGTFSRCPSLCPADCTRDGVVDSGDVAVLLSAWGQPDSGQGPNYPDIDGDGFVGAFDLTRLLDAWGPCP